MKISPGVTVARLAQLKPGDLFFHPVETGPFIGMVVHDPTRDGDGLIMSLGPTFPVGAKCPRLVSAPYATVISFGNDFQLRLPSQVEGWASEPPPFECPCIVVAERTAYFRANFSPASMPPQACYVDLATGIILTRGPGQSQVYASVPPGVAAFAVRWELLTIEAEPREILAYRQARIR